MFSLMHMRWLTRQLGKVDENFDKLVIHISKHFGINLEFWGLETQRWHTYLCIKIASWTLYKSIHN